MMNGEWRIRATPEFDIKNTAVALDFRQKKRCLPLHFFRREEGERGPRCFMKGGRTSALHERAAAAETKGVR